MSLNNESNNFAATGFSKLIDLNSPASKIVTCKKSEKNYSIKLIFFDKRQIEKHISFSSREFSLFLNIS